MIQKATVYSNEIEDRLLAPFYIYKRKAKKYELRLGDLVENIINGIDLRKFVKEGSLYLRIIDIKRNQVNLLTAKKVSETLKDVPTRIILQRNDILMSRKGTPGICTLATELEKKSIIGTEIIKIRLNPDVEISPETLVCFLNTKYGFAQIMSKLTGSVSRGINHPSLRSLEIPNFPKKLQIQISQLTQKGIRYYISALNKIIQAKQIFEEEIDIKHQEIKEKTTYFVNSQDLTDIFTPKFYYPKYLNTLKQLKKKFKTVKLGGIADIKRGNEVGSKNYRKYVDKRKTDVPFIRTSDLVNYEIDNYPDYYIDEEIYRKLNQDLKEGDILYTKDGKIGLSAIITKEDKFIIASGIARIRIKETMNPYYVFLVLSTEIGLYQALKRVVVAATLPHLQMGRLAEIEIPLIGPQKQKEISKLVQEAFELKVEKKRLIRNALIKIEEFLK